MGRCRRLRASILSYELHEFSSFVERRACRQREFKHEAGCEKEKAASGLKPVVVPVQLFDNGK
jgi:hypothetical protein